jgi:hemolysin activation/secretion protein
MMAGFARMCCAATVLAMTPPALLASDLDPSDAAAALARLSQQMQRTDETGSTRAATQPAQPRIFVLRDVRFVGRSGYLEPDQLQSAVRPFIGKRMTASRASSIAQAVDALYRDAGIDLAQARVVAVDPAAGIVSLDLFEARLGRLSYDARLASPGYLDFRLGLRPGDLADTRRIAQRLERLALTDGVLADAGFAPGESVGETDLSIALEEPRRITGAFRLDNYGDAFSGEARAVFSLQVNSVTGWNDPLAIDLLASEGSRSATLSYARPVTPDGGRLGLAISAQRSDSISVPGRSTETRSATLSYLHPLRLAPDRSLWASASLDRYAETAETVGVRTADQDGWALAIGLNGRMRPGGDALRHVGWAAGFVVGRYRDRVLGGGVLDHAALTASTRLEWAFSDLAYGVLSGALQLPLTDDTPSRGQFSVTKPYAVPGYPDGLSEGDGGYWLRFQVEMAQPLPLPYAELRPYALIAAGEAWDRSAAGDTWQGLAASAGVGLSGRVADKVQADVMITKPLTTVLGRGGGDDPTVNAALSVQF